MASDIIYRIPHIKDEEILKDYMKEHYLYGEKSVTCSMDFDKMPFDNWLRNITDNLNDTKLFICSKNNILIGLLCIRCNLNEKERYIIGDIGYGVRPTERKKGFASEFMAHGIDLCRKYGMKNIIIGCFKDNIPSAKTIVKNGGILIGECDAYEKGRMSQYYKIKL